MNHDEAQADDALPRAATHRPAASQASGAGPAPVLHANLKGQVALVTGATRGLGAQVVADLHDLGATVFAGARRAADLESVEADTRGKVRPVELDVRDERAIQRAVETAVRAMGRLDIVVNNAGIGDFRGRTLSNLPVAQLDDVLATNLRGPILVAQAAVPHLVTRPGGRIVNVSSGMGALSGMGTGSAAYRISKTGLNSLTAYLHAEYSARGVIANSVCPGWVRTDMGGREAPRSIQEGADTITWLCRFAPGSPGGRFWRDRHEIAW